jgi:hypothetical protein
VLKHNGKSDTAQGRIQDLKLGGAQLNNLRRAEGGAKFFGVFRVKNHDFTPKNHIFSNFRGGARRVRPPWIRPYCMMHLEIYRQYDAAYVGVGGIQRWILIFP